MTRMPSQGLLNFSDPRLGMRATDARPEDMATRAAMRILDDYLAGAGDRAIAAPAIGLPVRLLALRRGDTVIHVMNPALSAAGHFALKRAETGPLTGPIRRHVWRAGRVTLSGMQPSGLPVSEMLEGALAVSAQQALDLLDNRACFDWITPFHRSWATTSNAVLRARAEGLNCALHLAPWQSDPGDAPAPPLLAIDAHQVQMHDDAGQPVGLLDAADPSMPLGAVDRRCLGILLATSALRHVLILPPRRAPLAVSLLSMLPAMTLHHPPQGWPLRAMAEMQLTLGCRAATPADQTPAPDSTDSRMDAIVLDGAEGWLDGPDAVARMRLQARRMTGSGAIAVICCAAQTTTIEDLLQAIFPVLYVIEDPQAGAIYVAAKTRLDLEAARARAMHLANQLGRPDLLRPATEGWQLIAKSGDRHPL